jgi:ankyrin repeat protein
MSQTVAPNFGTGGSKNGKMNATSSQNLQSYSNISFEDEVDNIDAWNQYDESKLNSILLRIFKTLKTTTDPEAITKLFNLGVSPNVCDPEGKTPLMMAAEKGYLEVVHLLFDNKAEVKMKDRHGRNALFYALESQAENIDIISLLLDKGADVNSEYADKVTPLLKAVEKNFVQIARILLQKGANVHAASESTGNFTTLMI